MSAIRREQRYTHTHPCPICGHYQNDPRGDCHGFLSDDGEWATCDTDHGDGAMLIEKGIKPTFRYRRNESGIGYRPWTPEKPTPINAAHRNSAPPTKTHATERGITYFAYTDRQRIKRADFTNAKGELDKSCIPEHLVGGRWQTGDGPGPIEYIYRRAEVATRGDEALDIFEGEPCADAGAALGLRAMTWRGGTGRVAQAIEQIKEVAAGHHVRLHRDSDQPGRKAMQQIAAAISPMAVSVKIVDYFPDEHPESGGRDIQDWRAEGGNADDLMQVIADAPDYEPEAADGDPARLFTTYGPDDLKAMPPLAFRVEGWLPENSLIGIIGKSGDMKSFFALDQAFSIAMNRIWNGCDVCGGPVLYVAAEGRSGIGQRITAWETARHVALDNDRFRLITDAPQMLTDEHVDALIATVKQWHAEVIYLDTLARTMDGDENSTRDMSGYVTACNRIQRETGATVVVVHHMGWSAERGRGSSALFAAMDAEITVVKDGDTVTARITKAKDFQGGAEMAFTPRVVELENGGTSVVLDRTDPSVANMTGIAKRLGNILWDTFGDDGATLSEWKRVSLEKKIAEYSFFEGRKVLDKGGFITKPTTSRGHHYTVTEAFEPFITRPENPHPPENTTKPTKPSFSSDIASNPEMAAREGLGGFGEGLAKETREGLACTKSESTATTADAPEGLVGLDRFGEGLQTFTGGVEEDRFVGLPPPIGGKPTNLPSPPSTPYPNVDAPAFDEDEAFDTAVRVESEEIAWTWIVAVKAEREFGMPDAVLAAAVRLGCALDRFASTEEEAARLADYLDRHAAMKGGH